MWKWKYIGRYNTDVSKNDKSWNIQDIKMYADCILTLNTYRDADKSLAQPGRKQATATDFDFYVSNL
jgi:hypothetical protein